MLANIVRVGEEIEEAMETYAETLKALAKT
jgi:hypothetical protein